MSRVATVKKIRGTGNLFHNRPISNFTRPVELGIFVPMIDHKFITSIFTNAANAQTPPDASDIDVKQAIGNWIPDKNIYNFDGYIPNTCQFGRSSYDSTKEYTDFRFAKKSADYQIRCNVDMEGNTFPLKIGLEENDLIIGTRMPEDLVEIPAPPDDKLNANLSDQLQTSFIVRQPKRINTQDHVNTILGNISSGTTEYLVFPLTGLNTISPDIIYRFSFYYRSSGDITVTPYIQYFTNTRSKISEESWSSQTLPTNHTEDSDFEFFEIAIPKVKIPFTTRRVRIYLKIESISGGKLEIAYPILEHALAVTPSSIVLIPEHPSSIGYTDVYAEELDSTLVGSSSSFDASKLFDYQLSRKLFTVSLAYSLVDSNIVASMRTLENQNQLGQTIVLRPAHNDLPPALLGNFIFTNTNPMFDYHYNDLTINFIETA